MRAAFVVRVESPTADAARGVVDALAPVLRGRGAPVRFEVASRALPGTVVAIGVQDLQGRPRWLMPLRVRDDAPAAADEVLAFLERWGFIPRAASGARPRRAA